MPRSLGTTMNETSKAEVIDFYIAIRNRTFYIDNNGRDRLNFGPVARQVN